MKLRQLFFVVLFSVPMFLFAAEENQMPDANKAQSENVTTNEATPNAKVDNSQANQNPTNSMQSTEVNPSATTNADVKSNAQPATGNANATSNEKVNGTQPNTNQENKGTDVVNNKNLTQPTSVNSKNTNLNKVEENAPIKKDVKSFVNTTDGSKDFIKNMLELVYFELPKKANNQEIFTYLSSITNEYFAFSYMSKWSIGREVIKDIPEDQQERYLTLSKEFMVLLYGEIFNTYYKQYSYTLGDVETKSDTQYDVKMKVEPKVKDAKNQDSALNIIWKVKYSKQEHRFYIINVDINGVLLLVTQRKQFSDILKSKGGHFDKFLEELNSKNTASKTRLGISL